MDYVENWRWVRADVTLLSDVLLVTQRRHRRSGDAQAQLVVVAPPVFLTDVLTTNFECLNREFIRGMCFSGLMCSF